MYYGTELTSKAMFFWSARSGTTLHFIQPGKPTQNAFVESFNARFRDNCLTSTGSETYTRPGNWSKIGDATITRNDRIARWATPPLRNTLREQPDMMFFPQLKWTDFRGKIRSNP